MARVARPAVWSKKTVRPRRITHEEEALIEKATHEYNLRHYKSIRAAARAHNIEKHYFTLRRRVKGLALPKKVAHEAQQLLTAAEEATLVDWIRYLALTGQPVSKQTIRPKVLAILKAKGIDDHKDALISRSWIRRFRKRHLPDLKMSRGSGLDPKQAQAFNYTKVSEHFEMFKKVMEENNIPWRNMYNMDEKGIQMGGGRNGRRIVYFFGVEDKMKYKIQVDDLQLVTIIDCVCADGTAEIGPGFVFPGVAKHEEWFKEPGEYM